jgi:hypothetical protein
MLQCKKCFQYKDSTLFYNKKNNKKFNYCIQCHSLINKKYYIQNKEKICSLSKKRLLKDPKKKYLISLKSELKTNFGLTLEQYFSLLKNQNGLCAICNNPEKLIDPRTQRIRKICVDHCHKSKKIRGLLCSNCNRGLGLLKDSIKILESAIIYLKKFE